MYVFYALLSMVFAGVNDTVFKKYSSIGKPIGLYMAVIGIVWTLFFLILSLLRNTLVLEPKVLIIGTITGLFSATANVLFITSMKQVQAGIASTIYRLNLVFVAVLAWLLLGEIFTGLKIAGFFLAAGSVVLLRGKRIGQPLKERVSRKYLLILLIASFFRACMGIMYKYADIYQVSGELFLGVNGIWWIIAGVLFTFFYEKDSGLEKSVIRFGVGSGLLICGIVYFLKRGVDGAEASIVIVISQLSFLVTIPLSFFFFSERLNWGKIAGMVCAVVCIVLFSVK